MCPQLGLLQHSLCDIYSDDAALRTDSFSKETKVETSAASDIYDGIAGLEMESSHSTPAMATHAEKSVAPENQVVDGSKAVIQLYCLFFIKNHRFMVYEAVGSR